MNLSSERAIICHSLETALLAMGPFEMTPTFNVSEVETIKM